VDLVASVPRSGHQRSIFAALFVLWHLLSLDAPTIAVLWAWTLARSVGAEPSWTTFAVLGAGTWLIYVADRLLDGRAGAQRGALRERHLFHARHRRSLLIAAAIVLLPLVWLIVARMPVFPRREDACIFALALVYFAAVHLPFPRIRFPRELVVGIVFACACAVPAWSSAGYAHSDLAVLTALFATLCWTNCSAIHAWERPGPPRRSLVSLRALLLALAAGAFALAAVHNPGELRIAAALLASAMLLFALDRDYRRSVKRHRPEGSLSPLALRILADATLLTPVFLLIPWRK
jgi:hypothetical protein